MRAAVLGAGGIARVHLAALRALERAGAGGPGRDSGREPVETVAVCDLSAALAEVTAAEAGVPTWYTDHRRMLDDARPDVVHVTTPAHTHVSLARDALEAGCHVLVEKPIAPRAGELAGLLDLAAERGRLVVEDHNYAFQSNVRELVAMRDAGTLGDVLHVEVWIALAIAGPGSRYTDRDRPHPSMQEPIGAVHDFLTHMAYLTHLFVGESGRVRTSWQKRDEGSPLPCDEYRALLDCERGTALLGFSAHAQPDAFTLAVHGTRARARASLFQPLLAVETPDGPGPWMPVRNALAVGSAHRHAGWGGLVERLGGGPASYEGLFELVARFYAATRGAENPVRRATIEAVARMVDALAAPEARR